MTPEIDSQDPREVVLGFTSEYTAWEVKNKHADADDISVLREKQAVIARYCTKKKRAYIDNQVSISSPPVYGEINEGCIVAVEPLTNTKCHVDTQNMKRFCYRFVLVKKDNRWLIDSVKCRLPNETEWTSTLLGS